MDAQLDGSGKSTSVADGIRLRSGLDRGHLAGLAHPFLGKRAIADDFCDESLGSPDHRVFRVHKAFFLKCPWRYRRR